MTTKKPGRKWRTRTASAAGLAAILIVAAWPAAVLGGDSFLIPGVDLGRADFTVGKWCRYMVVDEIMGLRDSTTVYMAVTGKTATDDGEAYWLELESRPVGAPLTDGESAKALILSKIKDLTPTDSLYRYVSELYIKKGTGAVEAADPADLERLTLANPTSDSDWTLTRGEIVETPHGQFACDHKHLIVEDKRRIPMGSVTLVKNDSDIYDVWLCPEVPVFHLVRCVIERVRDSRTEPTIPGIPDKGREVTRTTVELLGFGSDASSTINIP